MWCGFVQHTVLQVTQQLVPRIKWHWFMFMPVSAACKTISHRSTACYAIVIEPTLCLSAVTCVRIAEAV